MLCLVWVMIIITSLWNSPVLHAAPDLQLEVQQAEINNQNQQLTTLIHKYTTLVVHHVKEEFLTPYDQIKYQQMLFIWNTKTTQTRHAICSGKNQFTQLLLLDLYGGYIEAIHLMLQLLTISTNEHPDALVHDALSITHHHHVLVSSLDTLTSWLEKMWQTDITSMTALSHEDLANSIIDDLPAELTTDTVQFLCGGQPEDNHLVTTIKNASIEDELPSLVHTLLSFITMYEQANYSATGNDTLLKTADTLLITLYEHSNQTSANPAIDIALSLLQTKIFLIKKKLTFNQELNDALQNQPALTPVFMWHHRLITSRHFIKIRTEPGEPQKILTNYINLIEHFFKTASDKLSPMLLYDLKAIRAEICYIIAVNNGGWVKKLWTGTSNLSQIFHEIIELIDTVLIHFDLSHPTNTNQYGDIVKSIMSGEWLLGSSIKKVTKTNNKNTAIQFAEDFLGTKEFPSLKSASLQALLYASPVLLMKVFEYFKPHMENAQNIPQQHDKILEFATKNPDLILQITERHPELLDFMAQSLKDITQA